MIRFEQDGEVGRLVLDRPERRNALSMDDWEGLASRCAEAEAAGARLLLVTGAAGAFCAGADLSEFPQINGDAALRTRFREAMRRGLDALRDLSIPTIALIEGPCFGAGVALAMACDIRIAAPDARFAITPAKIGIGYPQEDVAALVQLVGTGWAARLLFTGTPIDAAMAQAIGLVEGVGGEPEAAALTQAMSACDAGSISMLKRGIALAANGVVRDAGQDREFDALMGGAALAERLSQRRADRPLPPPEA